jgi:hypothetical protein
MDSHSVRSPSVTGRQFHRMTGFALLLGALGITSCTRDLCEGGGCQADGVTGSLMTARMHPSSKLTAEVSSAPADTSLAPSATASLVGSATSITPAPSASEAAPIACRTEEDCPDPEARLCLTEAKVCGQCETKLDCESLGKSLGIQLSACVIGSSPALNHCVECARDEECADKGEVCDGRGECAPCDSAKRTDGFAGCDPGRACLKGVPANTNACVGCRDTADCADGQQCDPVAHECTACIVAADTAADPDLGCGSLDAPRCLAGETAPSNSCVQCLTRDDCGEGAPECDPIAHACVTCRLPDPGEAPPALVDGGSARAIDWGCEPNVPRCLIGNGPASEPPPPLPGADAAIADASVDAPDAAADGGLSLEPHQCVECITSDDCTGVCNQQSHTCVQCTSSDDCGADRAQCDLESGQCVACDPAEHDADGKNPDCAHVGGKDICSSAGTCVQCMHEFDSACGTKVCDDRPPAAGAVTNTQYTCVAPKVNTATACAECVSDAQCKPGQACVLTTFGDEEVPVGYYCLYRQVEASELPEGYVAADDRETYGVSDCVAQAVPHVDVVEDTVSVSGQAGVFCSPRTSTCEALAQFGSDRPCLTDADCGVAGVADAKCVTWGSAKQCTSVCVSNADCPVGGNGATLGCKGGDGYCNF